MFTGIIETLGEIKSIEHTDANVHLWVESEFTNQLKIDQSVAHNGVCLTVVAIEGTSYKVTAIQETILKTTLGSWKIGDRLNLERGMRLGDRLDGHIVQGHVDQTAVCTAVENENGSWKYHFQYNTNLGNVTIPKGSITVNGVSLTVVDSTLSAFSVAIIPFTYEHTNFQFIQVGTAVNLEFDVIGKYVSRLFELKQLI